MMSRRGVSIVEVLLALTIVLLACLATLNYFAYAMGGIGTAGNRRAALERARQRLERLMAEAPSTLKPETADGIAHWVSCLTSPCGIVSSDPGETVAVDDWPAQRIATIVTWLEDVDSVPAPQVDEPDVLVFDVKVWFTSNMAFDNDANRVHLRTIRAP